MRCVSTVRMHMMVAGVAMAMRGNGHFGQAQHRAVGITTLYYNIGRLLNCNSWAEPWQLGCGIAHNGSEVAKNG